MAAQHGVQDAVGIDGKDGAGMVIDTLRQSDRLAPAPRRVVEGAHAIVVSLAGHILPGHVGAAVKGDDLAAVVGGAFAALFRNDVHWHILIVASGPQ